MLCIWLNNVSRLVFWQPPKCLSSAREVAKLFACFNKYNSHFWRYPKMSLGNCQQLWQLGNFGNFGNCCLAGRLKKGLSQCRNATRCSLITSYLFWQCFELFFLCWLLVINIDATVVMWRRHWSHLQLEPETGSLSVCLPVCLPVYQFLRPAGHSWADDVNSGRRFEYAWRGLEDIASSSLTSFMLFMFSVIIQWQHSLISPKDVDLFALCASPSPSPSATATSTSTSFKAQVLDKYQNSAKSCIRNLYVMPCCRCRFWVSVSASTQATSERPIWSFGRRKRTVWKQRQSRGLRQWCM